MRIIIEPHEHRPAHYVTMFFLAMCIAVFCLDWIQTVALSGASTHQVLTPVQQLLFFDLPPSLARLQSSNPENLLQIPFWRGIYDWILLKLTTGYTGPAEGPLFTNIREGQIWRLFSPCVLHRDFLHILFNMIWLWMLGRPIEQRIGAGKMLLVTLIAGIGSNVVQYLMSGPLFLGYSGVIMGLAGFIWMRQKVAPWENYPLQRGTILFLAFFVLAMTVLQMLSFFAQLIVHVPFGVNIANSAHISGAIIGMMLGRMSFFSWRVR
jgi:GlpG protein